MSQEMNDKDPYGISDVELRTDIMGTNSEMIIN